MNQEAQAPRGALEIRKRQIESSLQRRHRTERTFRAVGLAAVIMGLGFVALLFATILAKGLPAFWQATVTTEVFFDPAVIKVEARPVRAADENPQQFRDRELAWLNRLGMVNWNRIIEDTLITHLPDAAEKRPLVRQLVR